MNPVGYWGQIFVEKIALFALDIMDFAVFLSRPTTH